MQSHILMIWRSFWHDQTLEFQSITQGHLRQRAGVLSMAHIVQVLNRLDVLGLLSVPVMCISLVMANESRGGFLLTNSIQPSVL